MSAKQAAALADYRRLRQAIVMTLKRFFPARFSAAERDLGGRMSDVDDDILLAFVEAFINDLTFGGDVGGDGSDEADDEPRDLVVLRHALRTAGFPIGDTTDLAAWAQVVASHSATHSATTGPARPEPAGERLWADDEEGLDDLWASPGGDGAELWTDTWQTAPSWDAATVPTGGVPVTADHRTADNRPAPGTAFDDLFADTVPVAAQTAGDGTVGDDLADLWDADPFRIRTGNGTGTGPPPSQDADDLDDLFGDGPAEPGSPDSRAGPAGDLDDLFADATSGAPGDDLDDLFADATSGAPGDDLDDLFADATGTAPTTGTTPAPEPVTPAPRDAAGDDLDDLWADEPEPAPAPAPCGPTRVPVGDTGTVAARRPTGPAPARAEPVPVTIPLRPELVSTRTTTRRRRRPGVKATPATPGVPPADLPADVSDALLAAVAIPRPVFVADLVAVAGSRETVEDWEAEMRSKGAQANVTFVTGKGRHKLRGSLVLPRDELRTAATEFTNSAWGECMRRFKGTAVYELGVLLHRIDADLLDWSFGDHTAVFRTRTTRGLVGAVVALNQNLDRDAAARAETVGAVRDLITERLSLVAVLSTTVNGHKGLADAVTAAADDERWTPNMPVVTAPSWEWASGNEATARLLVGGVEP
jgi:hypothetical protein